jgi:hypothetical protein
VCMRWQQCWPPRQQWTAVHYLPLSLPSPQSLLLGQQKLRVASLLHCFLTSKFKMLQLWLMLCAAQ